MNILALDTGTNCGWAVDVRGVTESGVQVFDLRRGESPGMRYLRFNSWMSEEWGCVGCGIGLIVYEQTHNRGGAATEVAAGFATRVQEFCARNRIEHSAIHSATLKKFATGRGNAKKPEMILAAQRLKPGVTDDNESDALWLLEYARKMLVPEKEKVPDYVAAAKDFSKKYEDVFGDKDPADILKDIRG